MNLKYSIILNDLCAALVRFNVGRRFIQWQKFIKDSILNSCSKFHNIKLVTITEIDDICSRNRVVISESEVLKIIFLQLNCGGIFLPVVEKNSNEWLC